MIQVLHRCLDLLEWLAQDPRQPRLMHEMATRLEVSDASCSHLVKTLVQRGYLEKLGGRRGYILGPMSARLGQARGQYGLLVAEGKAVVETLAQETGETVLLATLQGTRRVLLNLAEGTQTIRVASTAWVQDDLYITATGRVLMAILSDEARAELVQTMGLPEKKWGNIKSEKALNAACATICKDGAHERLTSDDVVQLAVPVLCPDGAVAALGSFIPAYRVTDQHKTNIIKALQSAAAILQKKLA